MGNLLSRPLIHVLESSLLRAAELWDRGMRYVERSLSRFLSVCLGPLFGYERPSVLLAQRACDENGVCYIPATAAEEKDRRRRRAAEKESAAKRRKRKLDELERRKARAERAALGLAKDDSAINKKRFPMDEARTAVVVTAAAAPGNEARLSKDKPRKGKKSKPANEKYDTAAIEREMQEKMPGLVAKKRERKVSGNNKATPPAAAVVAPPVTKSEPHAYAVTKPLGEPIKAPPRITREEVGASPEKRKDRLWIMGNLPAASASSSPKNGASPPEPAMTAASYAAVPFEAPSMTPVRKSSRKEAVGGGPRRPSGPPAKLLDLETAPEQAMGANRVLLQLPANVAGAVGGHVRRASGEAQPVCYEVVASSSATTTPAANPAAPPSANHPHIRTRKSSKTKAGKAEEIVRDGQDGSVTSDRPSSAAHGKEPSTSSGFRRLSHAIASAEPSALYAPKGTAVPAPAPGPSLLPPPALAPVQPKAKHGRLSLDSSEVTLGQLNAGFGTASSTKADKRLSLQIPPTTASNASPPSAASIGSAAGANGPLGVLSKARASLDSLRLSQTIRPRLNSVTSGAVAAASAIGRAATPPVLSSLVGGGGSNPASPSSEDGSSAPIKSVAELADRACMSRWEAKGKERKVWRDEVNRVARERCIDNQRAAAAASSASLILGGASGGSSGAPTPRSATPVGGGSRMSRKESTGSPTSATTPPPSGANVVYNTTRQGLANLAVQNLGLTGGAKSTGSEVSSTAAGPAQAATGRRGSKELARPTAEIVPTSAAALTPATAAAPLARRKSNRERPTTTRLEGIEEASLGRNSKANRLSLGAGLIQPKAVRGVAA